MSAAISDRATITRPPTTLVPTYVPLSMNTEGLIYVGEDSDGPVWIDDDNITFLDGEETYDAGDSDYEFIDVIDVEEDDTPYDENGLFIEYDNTDLEREEETPPEPEPEFEWDEQGQMWKKKECCKTVYKFKTQTKWVKQKPVTKTAWKTRYKTIIKTAIKTAYKTITKTYKLPVQTTTVKYAVTTTKTFKLPVQTKTITKTYQKDPITVTKTEIKSYTYQDFVTKTYQRDYTITKTCTETVMPTCKGKEC